MSMYHEDEWWEEDDDETEVWGQSVSYLLYKGRNGKLCLVEGILTRYAGEDWGEASGWHEQRINLINLFDDVRSRVIALGRNMLPNTAKEIFHWQLEEDEDDDEKSDLQPSDPSLNDIPF